MKKFYIYRNLARGKPSLNLFRHAFRRATFPKGEGLAATPLGPNATNRQTGI